MKMFMIALAGLTMAACGDKEEIDTAEVVDTAETVLDSGDTSETVTEDTATEETE